MSVIVDAEEDIDIVDQFLRLIAHIREQHHRDPLRALEDLMLDLRLKARE